MAAAASLPVSWPADAAPGWLYGGSLKVGRSSLTVTSPRKAPGPGASEFRQDGPTAAPGTHMS